MNNINNEAILNEYNEYKNEWINAFSPFNLDDVKAEYNDNISNGTISNDVSYVDFAVQKIEAYFNEVGGDIEYSPAETLQDFVENTFPMRIAEQIEQFLYERGEYDLTEDKVSEYLTPTYDDVADKVFASLLYQDKDIITYLGDEGKILDTIIDGVYNGVIDFIGVEYEDNYEAEDYKSSFKQLMAENPTYIAVEETFADMGYDGNQWDMLYDFIRTNDNNELTALALQTTSSLIENSDKLPEAIKSSFIELSREEVADKIFNSIKDNNADNIVEYINNEIRNMNSEDELLHLADKITNNLYANAELNDSTDNLKTKAKTTIEKD